uniref:PX domain-containing protein n=1 Tax=Oryza barthii TaxID=65489 RepID=A0A0D3EVR4_9ORYZ
MAIFRSEGLKQNKCLPGPHLALSTLAFPGFDSQTPRLHPESHFPSRPRPQSSPPPPGPAMVGADAESSAAVDAGEDHGDLALDSSSAASTDPLLHPPPSPSSTPSSPTAIADHDAFIEEDGEDDSAPHVPSASDEAAPEFVQITVSEPKKHAEPAAGAAGVIPGSGSYFSYLITTRAADGGLFRVRRRFRDVVALADRLAAAYRGLFVPARPDKSIVEGQVMQRHEFVNQRCAALQRYLGRLAAHPTIGRSAELHDFLTEPSGIPTSAGESPRSDPALSAAMSAAAVTAPTAPAKPGRDIFGMFKDLKQTVANGLVAVRPPPVEKETDAKFVMHKAKLEYFEQHLTTASQQVEALLKAYDDLKATTGQLGMTFIKLAKFEKEQDTCNSQRKRAVDMSNFANAVINMSRSQTKLNAKIEIHLGTIYEYLETMTSVRNAFTDRANALLRVQSLSGDLFLLHTQAAKLESVSSRGMGQERLRYQKIEELKETIRKTEDAKGNALQEYELIKENNMNEIIRFNKEKRHGLVEMLKGFVRNQRGSARGNGRLRVCFTLPQRPQAAPCSLSGLAPFPLAAGASAPRLRLRRMLPPAPTRNPGACRFIPLLPPKPLLSPAAAAASSRGGLCVAAASRRDFLLLVPSIAAASTVLQSLPLSASAADDEKQAASPAPGPAAAPAPTSAGEPEAEALSRVYDATVIGEPQAVGKDARRRVWEKLMAARVVYLGEAELVPDRDDRVLELEVVRKLAARCAEAGRSISLALEAFPCNLQEQLNQFMDRRIDGNNLRLYTSHWAPERWQEYEPLLNYCRDNGVKLVACGTPLEVSRTVQAEGIRGLSKAQRKLYAPPAGSGFISGFTSISGRSLIDKISAIHGSPFGPSSYLSAQARVVDDYTMSQKIMKEITNGDPSGMLVVVTGSSHVIYGSRGIGVPARISKKMQKKKQVVVLLNPERQGIRREGEIPVADFLWYSAAKPCSRNCFDRAEIARVMNAAGRRREALPQDLQKGIDLGVVSPEILQNFFDLEKYPVMAELIHRFQGFRERLLADPKFLHRLAIEEGISITTTLIAQYEKRKGRFLEEIDYVLTDTIRGSVVDFFTVWLPAPTISLLSLGDNGSGESLELLKGLLGSLPDNAFQKGIMGQSWNTNQRFASVLMGGIKLAGVGFISSIGAGVASDVLYAARRVLRPSTSVETARRRTPIWKSATVYSCFLGTSANLRYQVIAGLVEHRLGEYLMAYYNQPLLANLLSFVSRTINSYWGTQQWIDLARATGLQTSKKELPSPEISNLPDMPLLECGTTEVQNMDDSNKQQPMK